MPPYTPGRMTDHTQDTKHGEAGAAPHHKFDVGGRDRRQVHTVHALCVRRTHTRTHTILHINH